MASVTSSTLAACLVDSSVYSPPRSLTALSAFHKIEGSNSFSFNRVAPATFLRSRAKRLPHLYQRTFRCSSSFSSESQNTPRNSLLSSFSIPPLSPLSVPEFSSLLPPPLLLPWERKRIGSLDVSSLGLGTWAWGNKFLWGYEDTEEVDGELQGAFNYAVKSGVNLFDTADSYGTGKLNGRSELLLGKFIREFPGSEKERANIRIATKLAPYPWRLTPKQMAEACRMSCVRLGLPKVAIAQLHWSAANYAPPQERALWEGLLEMKEKDLCDYVGVSNYGPKQMERIFSFLETRGIKMASAQIQFSLLSYGPAQREVHRLCRERGVALIAYSPLALGMLTGKYSPGSSVENEGEGKEGMRKLPEGPRGLLFRQILPGAEPLLRELKTIAREKKKSISQVAINWCACKGTLPIPGAKNLSQARENLGAVGWRLSEGEVRRLEQLAEQVPKPMIQNIFQTK